MPSTPGRSWTFPEIFAIYFVVLSRFTQCFMIQEPLNNGRKCADQYNIMDTNSPYHYAPSPSSSGNNRKVSSLSSPPFINSRRVSKFRISASENNSHSTTTTTATSPSTTSLSRLQSVFRDDQVDSIQQFATHVQTSLLQRNDFESFVVNGPKSPRKIKKITTSTSEDKRREIEAQKQNLRGSIRLVHGRLIELQKKKNKKKRLSKKKKNDNVDDASNYDMEMEIFIQVTVKYHGATDVVQNWKLSNGIGQRIIDLMIPTSTSSSSATESSVLSEWGDIVDKSTITELGFQSGELVTSDGSWLLDLATGNGTAKKKSLASCEFVRKIAGGNGKNGNKALSRPLSHDQPKNVLLPPSAQFFQKLGISDAEGKPKIGMSSKLRQCQKFVEIVSRLVNEYASRALPPKNTNGKQEYDYDTDGLQKKSVLRTIDMGCGRGYLTFSLHYHLMEKYLEKFDIVTRGIDMRPKLVEEINGIASDLGGKFGKNIYFTEGTIEDAMTLNAEQNKFELELPQSEQKQDRDIDLLIALHACDTATDDSIWYGIQRNSSIIVTAPCCHKEARRYLDPHVAQLRNIEHPLADMLRHNIYKERIAETVTDSIRALLLEIANYDVQVFEFIGGEHTSKNVMITALKRMKPRSDMQIESLRNRLKSLASLHGITQQKLAQWMNEILVEETDSTGEIGGNLISNTGMPKITSSGELFE